jgi:6-phosphogluconate dehydrogenase
MSHAHVGMFGLGVMGRNLALNLADHGFRVAAHDVWPQASARFEAQAQGHANVSAHPALDTFVNELERPRRIILLVKAGEVVDQTIAMLAPRLERGDMLIDAGNEFYRNTERRADELARRGLRFFGMGVSGGEEGARHGPSLMPGGDRAGYDELAPMLEKIAARADGACVTYVGPGGSGHYVKMVHNGIEYGDMQLIAESYDVLRSIGGFEHAQLADLFELWNGGELESFLVEISAAIFREQDPDSGGDLLDAIADAASMKGTGKWTVQEAASIAAPVPTIASAVDARVLSSMKRERQLCRALPGPSGSAVRPSELAADVRAALYAAKACVYAQGMALLSSASTVHGWQLDLAEIARIWTGGCIIRARFLAQIKQAFLSAPDLSNLLLDPAVQRDVGARQEALRRMVALGALSGVPMPAHASALAYYDTLRRARLPQSLTQAQRDYFGAHTYERVDRAGTFHTDWSR